MRDLDVFYGDVQAVRGVSLDVGVGEIVGIVGESGSGKSTLLRAIAHLLPPASRIGAGSILFAGQDITWASDRVMRSMRGSSISYLFQNAERSFDPLFTIGAQFDEVMRAHSGTEPTGKQHGLFCSSRGRSTRAARAQQLEEMRIRQVAALERMGFADPNRVLTSIPSELSGGMCQRVVLAFALAASPQLLLADEPTSSLDGSSQERVIDFLRELNEREDLAILVVSHDIELVASFASRIVVMHDGCMVEAGPSEQIMTHPRDAYTRTLIEAIPHATGEVHAEPLGARRIAASLDAQQAACAAADRNEPSEGMSVSSGTPKEDTHAS